MAQINIRIGQFSTGGPYSYTVRRNGVGSKAVAGLATFANAWNAIRDDLVTILATETVSNVTIDVQSN